MAVPPVCCWVVASSLGDINPQGWHLPGGHQPAGHWCWVLELCEWSRDLSKTPLPWGSQRPIPMGMWVLSSVMCQLSRK